MPRLTLWGMMQWDATLFDNMVLPEGMDNTIMINNIVSKAGDLYPYYQVPDRIKMLSGDWFKRKLYNFTLMYEALQAEYNPLDNYNRLEWSTESPDITRTETPNITHQEDGEQEGHNNSSTGGTTRTTGQQNSTTTANNVRRDDVSAYDAGPDVYVSKDRISDNSTGGADASTTEEGVTSSTGKNDSNGKTHLTRTETGNRINKEEGVITRHSVIKGNIGVTTSQQMLESELNLRIYDLYDVIANLWIDDFIVTIY